jgi:hypothetical protein
MISDSKNIKITQLGEFEQRQANIAPEALQFILGILRNDLYSNKIRSLIREYTVNAQDEHRKFCPDRPIEIILPTAFEEKFIVRDFAGGLTHEQVFKYFGDYGASNKRDDAEAVGFMGIGGKSAFCYTDSFTIHSYKDGLKRSYNYFIDEDEVGTIALMGTTKTEEPNGLEIEVPVEGYDWQTFQTEAFDVIRHFKVRPVIKGTDDQIPEPKTPILSGKDWRLLGASQSQVIMGEIAYPIVTKDYDSTLKSQFTDFEKWEIALLDAGLELDFPVGGVKITASREELQLNKFTIEKIRERLREIKNTMKTLVDEEFKSCKTLVEAKTLYYELLMVGSIKNAMKGIITEVEWNGQKIENNALGINGLGNLLIYTKKRKTIKRTSEATELKCSRDMSLWLDDTDKNELMYRRRATTLLNPEQPGEDVPTSVVILQVFNEQKLIELGLDPKNLPSFNLVKPSSLVRRSKGSSGPDEEKRKKHLKKVFKLDWNALKAANIKKVTRGKYWNSKTVEMGVKGIASDFWEAVEVENPEVEIPIERFHPSSELASSLLQLKKLLSNVEAVGIIIPTIYGTKKGDKDTFFDWLKDKVEQLSFEDVALKQELNGGAFPALGFRTTALHENHPVRLYQLLRSRATKIAMTTIEAKTELFSEFGINVPVSQELSKLKEIVWDEYPMVKLVLTKTSSSETMLDYIADVDVLNAPARKVA